MGEKSEEILLQMQKVPTVYDNMIQALESHFIPRRNIIFERFQFNSRVQLPGENIDSFIAAVHTLAANCNLGVLKEEFIRDRIVVGMLDKKTSEKMQLEAKLTLSDAILYARQAELQSQQNSVLQQQQSSLNVIAKQENTPKSFNMSKRPQHPEVKCKYCGLAQHKREICPARRSTCRGCGRFGHWDRVCLSKEKDSRSLHHITTSSEGGVQIQDPLFLGNVTLNKHMLGNVFTNNHNQWLVNLQISDNKKLVPFLVDSGADIVCIPSNRLDSILLKSLKNCSETISGPDGTKLKVLGKITEKLTYPSKGKSCTLDLFVIQDLKMPILGRPENPKDSSSGEKIVESDNVQCSDKPISISESAKALLSSVAPGASENIAPKRNKKRPNWFSDYIT
ncbi:uncharacterized protein LOC126882684 [Diabrotica virgifera virgifera]|uniref:CCHC-type domain-containing protein n=1 Tax=Diabrotica virgifera virgifera TaxID=50390 RepID=A0ABM5K099_DIAVI|nr:uncharacterized protein LOC126882684 [Diabrotica virgifera virgifera]